MKQFIRQCSEIERFIAATYREFAKSEHNDPELLDIWSQLAEDEEEHALQLDFATRLPVDSAFAGIAESTPDPLEMYEVVEKIYRKARKGYPSREEMLEDALTLENRLHGIHATHALRFRETSLLEVFERLAASEEQHVAGLQNYLQQQRADG